MSSFYDDALPTSQPWSLEEGGSVGRGVMTFYHPRPFPMIVRHVVVKVTGEGYVGFPFKNTEKERNVGER